MYTTVSQDTLSQHQPRHKKSRRTHTRNAAKKHLNKKKLQSHFQLTICHPYHPSHPGWQRISLTPHTMYVPNGML